MKTDKPESPESEPASSGISRRDFLKIGAAGGAALLLPWQLSSQLAYAAGSPSVVKFKDALPLPSSIRPGNGATVALAMRQFTQEVHSDIGPVTRVWGFGNNAKGYSSPGPTIDVRAGHTINVKWINRLARDPNAPHALYIDPRTLEHGGIHGATNNRKAVVHLHGGEVTQAADGYPEDFLLPGQDAVFTYDRIGPAGTLWYHDHAVGNTRLNVYMGLAGFFLVRSTQERALINNAWLPALQHEIPLALQDRRINGKGQLAYDRLFDDSFFGDVMLVNGKAWPHLDVEARKYRFRVLNGSNSRNYRLQLGGGVEFHQIGTDGGFLDAPVPLKELVLTPGERADIVIDFAAHRGQELLLSNHDMGDHGGKTVPPIHDVMLFRVANTATDDPVRLPQMLNTTPMERLREEDAVQTRYFKLEDVYDPHLNDSKWLINNKAFGDIDDIVQNNTVEVWNWVNKSNMTHPMHIHLVQAQILGRWLVAEDKDGNIIPGQNLGVDANEMGWKDTVRVGPNELVKVIARFKGHGSSGTELFPFHCHVLEHEDHEMMRQFQLVY